MAYIFALRSIRHYTVLKMFKKPRTFIYQPIVFFNMKRKVIQLAGRTFVVSLPTSWAREWDVKKGEELELIEDGPRLILSTEKSRQSKKGLIDLSKSKKSLSR